MRVLLWVLRRAAGRRADGPGAGAARVWRAGRCASTRCHHRFSPPFHRPFPHPFPHRLSTHLSAGPVPPTALQKHLSPGPGLPAAHFERLQITRYRPGQEFRLHQDSGFEAAAGWPPPQPTPQMQTRLNSILPHGSDHLGPPPQPTPQMQTRLNSMALITSGCGKSNADQTQQRSGSTHLGLLW